MKISFENATIADAVSKAARVAPSRGSAFDKAAGITITLNEENDTAVVKATNLDIYYTEIISATFCEGSGTWRLPSSFISGVLSKLPIGSGKEVTLEEKNTGTVSITSGRTKAQLRTMDISYFPEWNDFDPDSLEVVPDLGARIKQVEWAALRQGDPPTSGIHLDGQSVIATDRFRMAVAPCEAKPIYKPITVPSGILDPVIRTMKDVAIGIDEGQFLLMPDHATQIRTVIFDIEYPPIQRALKYDQPNSLKVKKSSLLEMVDRAMVFGAHDRTPSMTMYIGSGELAVMMSDQEMGLLGDVVDVPGFADHKRIQILFTPKNLTEALDASPSEQVEIFYNCESLGSPVRIDGGSGYQAWVMPRKKMENG